MKKERKKILDLLAKKHITADIAESLLLALDQRDKITPKSRENMFKQLVVEIKTDDGDDINIKIPLEFAKVLKSKNMSAKFDNEEFDIDIDEVIALANSGVVGEIVNIQTNDGDSIIIKVI